MVVLMDLGLELWLALGVATAVVDGAHIHTLIRTHAMPTPTLTRRARSCNSHLLSAQENVNRVKAMVNAMERVKLMRRTATRTVSLRAIQKRSSVRASSFPTLCMTFSDKMTVAVIIKAIYRMKMMET